VVLNVSFIPNLLKTTPEIRDGSNVVVMYKQTWIKEKNTYGNSHYPWISKSGRNIDYTGSCPNAERAVADHITLYIHAGWENKEIEDTVKAFKKVEQCYLR